MVKPWDTATIGDFLDFKNGLNKSKEFFGHGTPIVNYTDVYKKRGLKKNDVCGKVSLTRDEIHRFDARKNDVFFTRTSETPEEVGMSSVLLEDIDDCVFSGFVLRGRPKNDMFVPKYCKYCFTTEAIRSAIIMGCTYTTRALTNGKQLSTIEIVVPPKPEQEAIAKSLTEIDELISFLEKLITKKKAIKQGTMQELLTGKRRLPGYCNKWKTDIIPDVLQKQEGIKIGPFGSQLKKEYLLEDGLYKVYGQENVYTQDFSIGNRYLNREKFRQLQSCEVRSGDFLISTMGTIGKCAIVPNGICSGIMDSHLIRLRINEQKLMPEYLLHLFSEELGYLKGQTSKLSVGGIMDGLSTKIVNALNVFYPEDLSEQKAIADFLSSMNTEIQTLEQKLGKYRQIKQGMMQQLLTGKIRLT